MKSKTELQASLVRSYNEVMSIFATGNILPSHTTAQPVYEAATRYTEQATAPLVGPNGYTQFRQTTIAYVDMLLNWLEAENAHNANGNRYLEPTRALFRSIQASVGKQGPLPEDAFAQLPTSIYETKRRVSTTCEAVLDEISTLMIHVKECWSAT